MRCSVSARYILIILLFSFNSWSRQECKSLFSSTQYKEFLFGPEFTFTNIEMLNEGNANPANFSLAGNPIKERYWRNLSNLVKWKCKSRKGCHFEWTKDKHGDALKVILEDGFYFTIGIDSGVLEANGKPSTPSESKIYRDVVQYIVFDSAKLIGLQPHSRAGQGHIHISKEAFGNDVLAFTNFFVDFANRPEISFGALGNHMYNSPPLAALKKSQKVQFARIMNEFDVKNSTILDFINEIHSKVYTESIATEWGSPSYYQALNLTRFHWDKGTIEIRSLRPQESYDKYLLQQELFTAWINRCKEIKTKLPYIDKKFNSNNGNEVLNVYSKEQIVDSYYQLITQLNLSWNKFKVLLPSEFSKIEPRGEYKSVNYEL